MANKPIISIDVDDSAFDRFLENFNDYTAKVENMSTPWQELEKAMSSATGEMKEGAAAANESLTGTAEIAAAIALGFKDAVKAQHEFGRATSTSDRGMKSIAKTVKGLGHDIFGIATNILKMGAVGLGLGALGGAFGFGALASSALNRQRNSNSLGLTPGQLSSFQINAQQFLGTGALSAAADAQNDVTKAGLLAALGIDFGSAQRQSPGDLAFNELKAARAAWMQAQKLGVSPLQMPAVSSYLALGGNVGDIRNAAMSPLSALNAAQRATRADASGLDFDQKTAASWIMLKKTLDSAGVTIETDLIKALAPLAPQIASFSKEIVGIVSGGLKEFGDFLRDDVDWKTVGADFKALSSGLKSLLQLLGLLKGKPDPKDPPPGSHSLDPAMLWLHNAPTNAQIAFRRAFGDYDPDRIHALNQLSEKANRLPAGIMDRLAMDESGFGKNMISPAGALGPYQFMPGTAKDAGINPLDTRAASGAAGKMLARLYKKYGSWDKAVAAYNWGDGNLDADIAKHGADWLKYAPAETQGEVSNVTGAGGGSMDSAVARALAKHAKAVTRAGAGKPVKVSVTNSTSARVAVSINAAAIA